MSLNELVQESEKNQPTIENKSESNNESQSLDKKFIDYDDLLTELAVPSHNQHLYEIDESEDNQSQENKSELKDNHSFSPYPVQEKTLDPEQALRSGRRIAKMVDAALAGGATIYAKSDDFSEYSASHEDLNDLSEAWADVSQEYNIEMNPWFNVAFLSIATYGPLYFKAANDRRFNLMQKQINETNERLSKIESESAESSKKPKDQKKGASKA
jgi:hypothetical protein